MQRPVLYVSDYAPELRVAVSDLGIDRRGMQAEARVTIQIRNLVVPGMPTIHNWSSKTLGSIGLIRGYPSERRVASMHRLPAAAWRRAKIAAICGALLANSLQFVMS